MRRSLAAIATALLAASTLFATAAEAGTKVRLGFGFPLGSFTAYGNSGGGYQKPRRAKRQHYVRSKAKSDVKVTRKSTATKSLAKAQPTSEPKAEVQANEAAETENSSISAAAVAPEDTGAVEAVPETPEAKPNAPAKKEDCKKFFPSVGMTLSVPCE
jgi:hypothetical protein